MTAPALLVVAGVTWIGVALARRRPLVGALWAATASLVGSTLAALHGGIDASILFGATAWIGLAELVAIGVLAGWSTRLLAPLPLGAALAALTAAVVAVSEWRQRFAANRFVTTALLIGVAGCVVAGWLLRLGDGARVRATEQARSDERLAIAQELHDVVAHHVTGMVVQAQAGQLVARTDGARTEAVLASIESAGSEALGAMRRVVGLLRDDEQTGRAPTTPAATLTAVDQLARRSGEHGLPARVYREACGDDLPADVTGAVHRIVQESLTNAHRHASGATGVDIAIVRTGSTLTVTVADDGQPNRTRGRDGFGVVGMTERAHALGGDLVAGPGTTGGWRVCATFPLRAG